MRLEEITGSNGTDYGFVYDAFGRIIWRFFPGARGKEDLYYDGPDVVLEHRNAIGLGKTWVRYLHGPGADQPLAMEVYPQDAEPTPGTGNQYYFHADADKFTPSARGLTARARFVSSPTRSAMRSTVTNTTPTAGGRPNSKPCCSHTAGRAGSSFPVRTSITTAPGSTTPCSGGSCPRIRSAASLECLDVMDARNAIAGDTQLSRRLDQIVLPRWKVDEEFHELISAVLCSLPINNLRPYRARAWVISRVSATGLLRAFFPFSTNWKSKLSKLVPSASPMTTSNPGNPPLKRKPCLRTAKPKKALQMRLKAK